MIAIGQGTAGLYDPIRSPREDFNGMGTWRWQLLRAGSFRLDGGAMFGIIPKVLWSRDTPCDDKNRISLQTNCLLLENGSRRVLVESGYGNKSDDKMRAMFEMEDRSVLDALSECGCDPESVTDVVLTHLHFDHAGGVTKVETPGGEPRVSFPNAAIHVQRTEWEDALANKSTMTRTYLRENLEPIADQIRLLEGETEVVDGLRVLPVPGHTWGQQAVLFEDDEGLVVFPGDVMPTAAHSGVAYNMAYDILPFENIQTKRRLLDRAASEGWRVVIDHEPGNPIRHVSADAEHPGRYELTEG